MRRGRKLRSKNSRACSFARRPASKARPHTCLRAKYIGRVSRLAALLRSRGRQLATKVAKARPWSSAVHPSSAFQAIGSSCESGTFSGSNWDVDASSDLTGLVTSSCVFGPFALLPYWAVRADNSMPMLAVTTTYRHPRYTGCPRPAVFLPVTALVRSGVETTAIVLTCVLGNDELPGTLVPTSPPW